MNKCHVLSLCLIVLSTLPPTNNAPKPPKLLKESANIDNKTSLQDQPNSHNDTIYKASKNLCWGCIGDGIEFLYAHNVARAAKWEFPLLWDPALEHYARWWAGVRRSDCLVRHSIPETGVRFGENIFWGGGAGWTPTDAVRKWIDEEENYDYATNACAVGRQCGHYTQIVWRSTRRLGCARVVCDNGDVFVTCNYDPPGNYVGERPY